MEPAPTSETLFLAGFCMFPMNSGRQVAQELKKQHHPLRAVRQQPGGDAFSQEQEQSVHLEKKGNRL